MAKNITALQNVPLNLAIWRARVSLPGTRRQAIRFATARQEPYTMSHDNGFREAATDDEDGCSEQESFFQCLDRVKPPGDGDPVFPSDDGEEDGLSDAARVSFATAVDDRLQEEQAVLDEDEDYEEEDLSTYDYDMWMEADDPVPIKERRRRLLHGMGLNSNRDILRSRIARTRNISRRPPRRAFAPSASSTPPEIMKRQPSAFLKRCRDRDRSSALPSAMTMSKSKSASAAAAADSATSSSSTERLKVHHSGQSSKDLTGLYMRQEVRAHEGSIWSIKFSADAQYLASGGEDRVVRVWQVVHTDASPSILTPDLSTGKILPPLAPADGGSLAGAPGLAALSRKVLRGKSSKHVLPEHVVLPETVFALAEQPACVFEGHEDDVLDLSWSKQSSRLLSSSMDKTVRLWDVESKACLQMFGHSDYVTCIQFNPADEGYFISGSLDCRVRIWSVAERQVVDWSDLNDMVTAASYTPDGQAAIVGSHKGCCRFYKTRDCKLNQEAQIDMSISKKRKSQAKKITGFQFAPGNPSEILVTSADSQIRVFNGITVLQKFKGTPVAARPCPASPLPAAPVPLPQTPQRTGNPCFCLPGFKNTSSQLSASYSGDGRYVGIFPSAAASMDVVPSLEALSRPSVVPLFELRGNPRSGSSGSYVDDVSTTTSFLKVLSFSLVVSPGSGLGDVGILAGSVLPLLVQAW
uniref:WD repeat-containing protein 44 n=1 Tax=Aegilops tauschii TaxID=37682 RepID=M8CD18_AEGTA